MYFLDDSYFEKNIFIITNLMEKYFFHKQLL